MTVVNNERGGALLMVLMLVVVLTVLGMGLMSMNISASKQFDKKEEQVQARHQAEMGLLHYKLEIKDEIKKYSFVKGKNETKEKALERSRNELCDIISAIEPPFNLNNGSKYATKRKDICGKSPDGGVFLELSSEGTSNKTSKLITGTASFTPPNIIDEVDGGIIPGKPQLPEGENPQPELPNNDSAVDVEVNGPVITKKETQSFGGSLVINKAPNNQKTFEVEGGNGYNLTVAKDFYIGGDFHSQNHSCITVKGDLTILGKSYLGNKSVIVVYGNAYFEAIPELQNDNSKIYVAGNTFLGKPPEKTANYKKKPSFGDCKKPDDFKYPYEPENPYPSTYQWELEDKLNPVYE